MLRNQATLLFTPKSENSFRKASLMDCLIAAMETWRPVAGGGDAPVALDIHQSDQGRFASSLQTFSSFSACFAAVTLGPGRMFPAFAG
jgi:hypothetical protein